MEKNRFYDALGKAKTMIRDAYKYAKPKVQSLTRKVKEVTRRGYYTAKVKTLKLKKMHSDNRLIHALLSGTSLDINDAVLRSTTVRDKYLTALLQHPSSTENSRHRITREIARLKRLQKCMKPKRKLNFYMLVGVPGAGKSTWIQKNLDSNTLVASSDDYIERKAKENGTSYNLEFAAHVKDANDYAQATAAKAFNTGANLIWDQTNLNEKTRAPKLAMVPSNYNKIAVYFRTPPPEVHRKRLEGRVGKTIPENIMQSMINALQPPTIGEGYDKVLTI
jgi:predicted kinase